MAGIYKLRARDTAVLPFWVDGAKIRQVNNELKFFGGWNPEQPGDSVRPFHYKSVDGGANFSSVDVMPQGGRTEAGAIVKNNTVYIYGGNDSDTTSANDVWGWDAVNGWQLVTADWGIQDQYCNFGYCAHKNYGYAGLGQTRANVYVNDIYRAPADDMGNWQSINPVIPAAMQNLVLPCFESLKGKLYCFAGGRLGFPSVTPYYVNTKVFRSDDDGVHWVEIADEPLLNSGLWGNSTVAGGDTIIYISGSDANNSMTANNRILFSYDGIKWRHLAINVNGRHATAVGSVDDDAIIACGFGQNDAFLIERINP